MGSRHGRILHCETEVHEWQRKIFGSSSKRDHRGVRSMGQKKKLMVSLYRRYCPNLLIVTRA